MALFKTNTSRRLGVRKAMARGTRSLQSSLSRTEMLSGIGLTLFFVVVSAVIVLIGKTEPRFLPGQLVNRTIYSRTSFESLNQPATEEARKRAAAETPTIYQPNTAFLDDTYKRLLKLPETVASVESVDKLAEDIQADWHLDATALQTLKSYLAEGKADAQWQRLCGEFIQKLGRKAFLDSERYQIELQNTAQGIQVAEAGGRFYEYELLNVGDDPRRNKEVETLADSFASEIRRAITAYYAHAKTPTAKHDATATEREQKARADAVAHVTTRYEPNQVLLRAGQVLDADGYTLLMRERQSYMASLPPWAWWMQMAGPTVLVALVALAMVVCVGNLRPRVARNPMRGLALAGLLLLALAMSWGVRSMGPNTLAAAAIGPAVLIAVILTIAYDARLALALTALHTVLIGQTIGLSLGLFVTTILTALIATVQLRDIRKRGLLVRMGIVTGLVAAVAVFAVGFSERQFVQGLPLALGYEALNSFFAATFVGFFVLGILSYIERAFKITTPMTLLELADMNHPLLRRLSQQAAGTFNHSLQVGMLAEAGCEAIGANGLLARVGGYYHDIGKVHKPEYFVENQSGSTSRHDKLSPAMSLLIIVAHVKDGIEIAREYHLPRPLHHFIESHHGTTLVEYFYHAAKKSRLDDQQPSELEFRYPGPKPQSREAAVLMVCDAAESACRAMAEPTPTRIEQLVHKLLDKRLLDGQFDECEITLNELRKVALAVAKALTTSYHGRVAYPEEKRVDRPAVA